MYICLSYTLPPTTIRSDYEEQWEMSSWWSLKETSEWCSKDKQLQHHFGFMRCYYLYWVFMYVCVPLFLYMCVTFLYFLVATMLWKVIHVFDSGSLCTIIVNFLYSDIIEECLLVLGIRLLLENVCNMHWCHHIYSDAGICSHGYVITSMLA